MMFAAMAMCAIRGSSETNVTVHRTVQCQQIRTFPIFLKLFIIWCSVAAKAENEKVAYFMQHQMRYVTRTFKIKYALIDGDDPLFSKKCFFLLLYNLSVHFMFRKYLPQWASSGAHIHQLLSEKLRSTTFLRSNIPKFAARE